MRTFVFFFITVYITANISVAQSDTRSTQGGMPEPAGHMSMSEGLSQLIEVIEQHATAGTDVEPISTPQNMLMTSRGEWMFMLHGVAFLNETQQTGPRGGAKFFSTNWIMPMAQRELGRGTLTLRTMLSLEPATVSDRRYPLLFQQGETAFGRPIVDGQHPHDFFMEVAAMYDAKLGENTLLSIYFAPMGSPALGPMAYPHRASASENPVATLGHHLQDSTHIADDVITVGLTHRKLRIEASGFHGREPDEFRWNLDSGKIDSWATRFTVNPGQNWGLQYSIGQLASPEELAPAEDLRRMTASVMYNRPFRNGNWALMLLWGRNQSLTDENVGNSYLAESTVRLHRNSVWTRIENTDRTNELLLDGSPIPPGFEERYFTRMQAYTVGYDREIGHIPHLSTALGGQLTCYGVPDVLKTAYGDHPIGANVFLRGRIE
ncbi:MAG TPA: hypothetical protein VJR04_15910 [Terriglobales bacterium]|nr:hypothetical protein [Terriglobales bacterium]